MGYPKNQIEFEKIFSTEEKCLSYLISIKWEQGFECKNCGSKEYWVASRKRMKCKTCNHIITLTAGTIFDQSNKPISLWFRAIWWMIAQKNGVSATGLQSILGLGSYKTAWLWLHKLRYLMVLPERTKLNGTVEIDETLVGGQMKGKRGRGSENKSVVMIAVELTEFGTGRIRLQHIPDASGKNLYSFIENNVIKGSCIITDGWNGYSMLGKKGYKHDVNRQVIATTEEEMLPNVHRVAALLKRWLLGTHQNFVSSGRLQSYLDEYTFRYNRRKSKSRGLLFHRIIQQAMKHEPVKNKIILESKDSLRLSVEGGKR
jgi:transposase-like protein